jgi:hypothetical protein
MIDETIASDDRGADVAEGGDDGAVSAVMVALHRERAARRSAEAEARKAAEAADQYQKRTHRLLIEREISNVVREVRGNYRLLLPHIEGNLRVFEENGEDEVRVVGDDGSPRWGLHGPMTTREFVEDLRRDPDTSRLFAPPEKAAEGAPKPMKTYSRREWQAALASADPEKRAALMRDAASGRIAVL